MSAPVELLRGAVELLLCNVGVTFLVAGVAAAAIVIALTPRERRDAVCVSGAFLNQFLLCAVGVYFLCNFVVNSVFAETTAPLTGWAQTTFQAEVAVAGPGFAVGGFLALGTRQPMMMKLAALLGPAVCLWAAAAGHLYQLSRTGAGVAGATVLADVVLPLIGFGFLWWHAAARDAASRARRRRRVKP